jgi:transcriptional regulator of heat shock response
MEYLEQPYTSAGRILSDWGWQVLIQDFLDNVFPDNLSISFNDIKDLTKYISKKTKSFSLAYNWKNNDIYTTGLEYIFNDKIINNTIHLYSIAKSIDNIDNTILGIQNILHDRQINVFIGKNNPLIHTKTFSFIATKSNNTNLIVGIITPKVTRYEQHFKIFKSLINSLN